MQLLFYKLTTVFCLVVFSTIIIFYLKFYNKNANDIEIVLNNGLKVLLCENQNIEKTSFYIQIDVGAINGPPEAAGLAHLLEHMIILRSSKYPEPNALITLGNSNPNSLSVISSREKMIFDCKIDDIQAFKIADMLANSLTNPIFDQKNIENEINVIEQEYNHRSVNSKYKIYRLIELAIEKEFPESIFLIGNKETLSVDNVKELLEKLHSENFTPDRIKLVIQGKQSLKELKKLANLFEILPKRNSQELSLTKNPVHVKFSEEFAGKIVKYFDRKDKKSVCIVINTPSLIRFFKNRMFQYLTKVFQNLQNQKEL